MWWLIIFLLIFGPKFAKATEKGINLSPTYTDIVLDRENDEKSFEIEVRNNTSRTEIFELTVVDFGTLDETGGIAFLTTNAQKGEQKYSLASWIVLEKDSIIVNSQESQKIRVTIVNKESLSAGGHYGAILATAKSDSGSNDKNVAVNRSMASLIYVLKKGGEKTNLIFNSMEYKNNWFKLPEIIQLRFQNDGNSHVIPRGKLEIYNLSGRLVGKGVINQESGKLLPESFRRLLINVKYYDKWKIPGKYRVEVKYRYDGKDSFQIYREDIYYVGLEGIIIGFLLIGVIEYYLMIRPAKKR